MLWVGHIPVMIDNDMIHKLTSLSNEGSNPNNEKSIKKLVETNIELVSYGRNMKLDQVKKIDVRIIRKIIGYKINYRGLIRAYYMMTIGKRKT